MNISVRMAKAIFSTSDKGAVQLYRYFSSDKAVLNEAMREYIYLKYFLTITFMAENLRAHPSQKQQFDIFFEEVLQILGDAFSNDVAGYGCDLVDMSNRMNHYMERVDKNNILESASYEFSMILGIYSLYLNVPLEQLRVIANVAGSVVMNAMSQQSKGASGGCLLPIVATIALLALIL